MDTQPIQTKIVENKTLLQTVLNNGFNVNTFVQDVPQIQTVLRDNVATVSSIINAPFVEVTSVNGMTGDVVTEPIMQTFQPNHYYLKDTLVNYNNVLYWAKATFTSGNTFDASDWNQVTVGADWSDIANRPTSINVNTGAQGTTTSLTSGAVTLPITNVYDSYVTWGGKNRKDGDLTPSVMGCIDEFGHNRFAYLNANCVKIAFSRDGGSTWTDYTTGNGADVTATDASKVKLMTFGTEWFSAGGQIVNTAGAANEQLRIRIAAWKNTTSPHLYMLAKYLLINVTTEGAGGTKVRIRHRTIANWKNNTETWTTVGTYDVGGCPGWNSIPYLYRFGGGTNQTSQLGEMEFVFTQTSVNSSSKKNLRVGGLRCISSNLWQQPSEMANTGRLYTIDESQNATFPSKITSGDITTYNLFNRDTSGTYGKIGTSDKPWTAIYLSDGIYNQSTHLELPTTAGTLALTTDIPTITSASTSEAGIVQLSTSTTSTSTLLASTPSATRLAYLHGAWYGTCSTTNSTIAKAVTCSNFALQTGSHITIKFTNANTASSPTLNVNSTGAKPIYIGSSVAGPGAWQDGDIKEFVYDGTNWCLTTNFISVYPVGSIYMSVSHTTADSVRNALGGGTWEAWGTGRVPLGMGSNGTTNYTTVEDAGGEERHQLTEAELPVISGSWRMHAQENGTEFYNYTGYMTGTRVKKYTNTNSQGSGAYSYQDPGFKFGQNQTHNNMQPYITVYMWKRTA